MKMEFMKMKFTPEFCSFIGSDNVFSGELFSMAQCTDIVKANIEMLLSESCSVQNVTSIKSLEFIRFIPGFLYHYKEKYNPWDAYCTFPVSGNPQDYMFSWKVTDKRRGSPLHGTTRDNGRGFVSLCSTLCGCSELDAINVLARINSLAWNSTFNFKSDRDGSCVRSGEALSYNFLPCSIKLGTENYLIKNTTLLQDSSVVKGAFVLYSSDTGLEFLLPCCLTIKTHEYPIPCNISGNILPPKNLSRKTGLEPGESVYFVLGQSGRSCLLNMHQLGGLKEFDFILLFECPLLAIKVQNLIESYDKNVRDKILVTSWFGGYETIEHADFSYLHKKNIIFIPKTSVESYSKICLCYKKCLDVMVLNFSILLCPITLKKIPRLGESNKMQNFEKVLATNAVSISELNEHSLIEIITKSCSFEDFKNFLKSDDLSLAESIETPCNPDFLVCIDDISDAGDKPSYLSYDNIVQSKNITIIIGPNNSGKSLFLLTILRAISDGTHAFHIPSNSRRTILLIDGESNKNILLERIKIIKSALGVKSAGYKNFYAIGMGFGSNFDFSQVHSREIIEKILNQKKIDVIAFDNLNSLIPGHVQATAKISDFFVWLRYLEEKYGIAIILAHHTKNENAKIKRSSGSKEIDEKCQTVIAITGRNELEKLQDDKVKSILTNDKLSKGALFQAHVIKCKQVHRFEDEIFYCHLPFYDKSSTTDQVWLCSRDYPDNDLSNFCQKVEINTNKTTLPNYSYLTEVEAKVMNELAHVFSSFSRKQVDDLLKCSAEKSRKIINALLDDYNLIIATEDRKISKRVRYCLSNNGAWRLP